MTTRKMRAYTTRKMNTDHLRRIRLLAAILSAEQEQRVTMETVLNRVLEAGLPVLERQVFGK